MSDDSVGVLWMHLWSSHNSRQNKKMSVVYNFPWKFVRRNFIGYQIKNLASVPVQHNYLRYSFVTRLHWDLRNTFFQILQKSVISDLCTTLFYRKFFQKSKEESLNPSRLVPGRREKINLNFYFHISLCCFERFYGGLIGYTKSCFHTTLWNAQGGKGWELAKCLISLSNMNKNFAVLVFTL